MRYQRTIFMDLSNIPAWAYILTLGFVWFLLNFRTKRPEGTFVKMHPFRRMLGYIMPTRSESVVFFDREVRAEKLIDYIAQTREHFHCDVTHIGLASVAKAFEVSPVMNRFVVGRRLYHRKGLWLSTSVKRKKKGKKAKLAAVKLELPAHENFEGMCKRLNEKINVERSNKVTYSDKELNLFEYIPRPILRVAVKFFHWLDYYNFLPASFIRNDAMHCSLFLANLGSLGMDAGYHHLYEWGTCPLFMMVGKIEERPVVEDGKVVVGKVIRIRFTLDERIEDGLNAHIGIEKLAHTFEDPFEVLGCLDENHRPPLHTGLDA